MTKGNDRNIRTRPKISFVAGAILLVAIVSMMTGCATTMSREEAKQITVTMEETAITKPSRRITDILAVLDQKGQFDSRSTAQMKARLSVPPPPPEANDAVMARFHRQRGVAEWQLGFMKPALADLHLALRLFPENRPGLTRSC